MLRHLFISKVRVKLLEEFFGHPQKMFYGRQLERKTNEQINAVRRELENLRQGGVLQAEKRGNRIYYSLNRRYPFYDSLLLMIVKRVGLGKKIIKNRHRLGKIQAVFFSRRFAEGLSQGGKEVVDILFVGRIILPELAILIKEEQKRREREINYTVMDEKEFRFRLNGRDPFLTALLIKPRLTILGNEDNLIR